MESYRLENEKGYDMLETLITLGKNKTFLEDGAHGLDLSGLGCDKGLDSLLESGLAYMVEDQRVKDEGEVRYKLSEEGRELLYKFMTEVSIKRF
jgi:hypothetical protein